MLLRAKKIGLVARRAAPVSDFRAQSYCFYDKKKNSVRINVRFLTFFSYISNTITINVSYMTCDISPTLYLNIIIQF